MAKQKGIIKLTGKIGDLSFYKSKDGYLAREKGGVDGERIKNNPELPNFLANCYLKSNLNFKTKDKNELVRLVKDIIASSVLKNEIPENPIIERIFQMPHSKKN